MPPLRSAEDAAAAAIASAPAAPWLSLALVLLAGCIPYTVWRAPTAAPGPALSVEARGGRRFVREGSKDGPRFLAIAVRSLRRSRDGRHLSYPARTAQGWRVVRDGQAGPAYDEVSELLLSSDGAHLAYAARRGALALVVHDGREGPALDEVLPGSLRFGAGGERLAYVGRRGAQALCVVDGQPGPRYQVVTSLRFSEDGRHLGYLAQRRAGPGEPTAPLSDAVAVAVVDGHEGPAEEAIVELALDQSGRSAYLARRQRRWRAVVDGVPGPEGESASQLRLADGHVAYALRAQRREWVVRDGAADPPWERVTDLTLSRDGRRCAYVAHQADQERVIHDGLAGPAFTEVGALVLTSEHLAYAARQGRQSQVLVDGAPGPSFPYVGTPVLSLDGGRCAYLARRSGAILVVTATPGEAPRESPPLELAIEGTLRLSRDGRRWGVVAGSLRDRRLAIVIDGREVRPVVVRQAIEEQWRTLAGRSAEPDADAMPSWVEAALSATTATGD